MGGNMADDAVQPVLDEIENRFLNDWLGSDFKNIQNVASLHTKGSLLKDLILKRSQLFVDTLNREFKDVTFFYKWCKSSGRLNTDMYRTYCDPYDIDFTDDEDEFDSFDYGTGKDDFYKEPIKSIDFILRYEWNRICSLGCKHKKVRYCVWNVAKLATMISWIEKGMPVKMWIREFLPDFFYDPLDLPKKKTRSSSKRVK